jgi:hypothetical protein
LIAYYHGGGAKFVETTDRKLIGFACGKVVKFRHDQVATMVKYFLRRMTMEVDYARKGVAGAGLGLGK